MSNGSLDQTGDAGQKAAERSGAQASPGVTSPAPPPDVPVAGPVTVTLNAPVFHITINDGSNLASLAGLLSGVHITGATPTPPHGAGALLSLIKGATPTEPHKIGGAGSEQATEGAEPSPPRDLKK